jgi:hypothetical protein
MVPARNSEKVFPVLRGDVAQGPDALRSRSRAMRPTTSALAVCRRGAVGKKFAQMSVQLPFISGAARYVLGPAASF